MAVLTGFLILSATMLVQITIASKVPLLQGTMDVMLLVVISWVMHEEVESTWEWGILAGLLVGFVSQIPFWVPILGYLGVIGLCLFLRSRVWQIPIIALGTALVLSTLIFHSLIWLSLSFQGSSIGIIEAFNQITLPTLLLNLIGVLPIYAIIGEISNLIYPKDLETKR